MGGGIEATTHPSGCATVVATPATAPERAFFGNTARDILGWCLRIFLLAPPEREVTEPVDRPKIGAYQYIQGLRSPTRTWKLVVGALADPL